MRTTATACLAFALAGCGLTIFPDPNERAATKAEASCRAIGLHEADEKWTDCMIEMMAAEKRAAATRRAAAQAREDAAQSQGMSFMCKDAVARGDSGGTFVFC